MKKLLADSAHSVLRERFIRRSPDIPAYEEQRLYAGLH